MSDNQPLEDIWPSEPVKQKRALVEGFQFTDDQIRTLQEKMAWMNDNRKVFRPVTENPLKEYRKKRNKKNKAAKQARKKNR